MTHTTTDAAEARALEKLKSVGERDCYRDTDNLPRVPQDTAIAAMIAFATAEAASGAGEREAIAAIIDPAAMKSMDAHTAEWQAWVDEQRAAGVLPDLSRMAPDSLVRELASKDYDAQANARTRALAKADAIRSLASLPPATDPAKPTSEMLDAAEREGWDRAAAEEIWLAMSLAAAPTIPATGEAAKEGDGWCSRCGCGNDAAGYAHLAACPTRPKPATAEQCAQIARTCDLYDGDHLRNSDPRETVAQAIEATIPATGHAATEGEG